AVGARISGHATDFSTSGADWAAETFLKRRGSMDQGRKLSVLANQSSPSLTTATITDQQPNYDARATEHLSRYREAFQFAFGCRLHKSRRIYAGQCWRRFRERFQPAKSRFRSARTLRPGFP